LVEKLSIDRQPHIKSRKMYLSHYSLTEKPFQLSPNPRFLWLGETHKEALATLRYGILDNRGLLLLVGDVGTGKTTLINGLLNSLDEDTTVATVFDPGLEKLEFLNFLANAFKMEKHFESKGDFLVHFVHFLNKIYAEGRKALLIIDEAQRMSHEMLEEIRLLSNIEKQDTKLLNIFLVGQNELLDTLADQKSRAFTHRITTSYNIKPLKKGEIEDYIRFRLKVAGTEKRLFTKGAIRAIASFSDCYPRLINKICDHALLTGFVNDKSRINAGIVKECSKELLVHSRPGKQKSGISGASIRKAGLYAIIPVLLLLVLGGYVYLKGGKPDLPFGDKGSISEKQPRDTPVKAKVAPVVPDKKKDVEPAPKRVVKESLTAGGSALKKSTASQGISEAVKERPKEETVPQAVVPEKPAVPEPAEAPVPKVPRLLVPAEKTTITLPFDSVTLSNEAYAVVNHLAEIAVQNPEVDIHVKGYTDSSGSAGYNKNLSKFRAEFFKSYFVGRGIKPDRIKTFGMGSEDPVASNATLKGKKANRRVEIEFMKKEK